MSDLMSEEIFEKLFQKVKGKLTYKKLMHRFTWLGVGGEAELFFQPVDMVDLSKFLFELPREFRILPVGVCSNLLVSDNGIRGATIRLGKGFSGLDIENDLIIAGAGALDSKVADFAAARGIDLSFLKTIPGTIGGAVKMNAGCYGHSISDVLVNVEVVLRSGELALLSNKDIGFSYRRSNLPKGSIVTKATFKGSKSNTQEIEKKMELNQEKRRKTQPIKQKTGGSTFKNPRLPHRFDGKIYSAWELIEKSNLRGTRVGGAQVSDLHANFLINNGSAKASDFERLGQLIIDTVFHESGIKLEWEIIKVGY